MSEQVKLGDLTVKQSLHVMVGLLMEIRDLLANGLADADEDDDSGVCPHPEEKRVSISTPGDLNHWVCALCKYDNKQSDVKH